MTKIARALILLELIGGYALPLYLLFWGVLTLPVMLIVAIRGEAFAVVSCLTVLGGCLGAWALFDVSRYLLARKSVRPSQVRTTAFSVVGILSLWVAATGQFQGLEFDEATVLMAIAPTVATAHLLWLARRRSLGSA